MAENLLQMKNATARPEIVNRKAVPEGMQGPLRVGRILASCKGVSHHAP